MPEEKEVKEEISKEESSLEEVVVEEKEKEVKETEKEASDEEEVEETEEEKEVAQALNLYKALKGPSGSDIVRQLAEQAGIIARKEGLTPKETKKAVVDVLREELGEEYGYLAERFGKALEKIIQSEIGEVKNQFKEHQKVSRERELDLVLNRFYVDYPDVKEVENKMSQLMDEMVYSKGDMYKYLERIYKLAGGKQNGKGSTGSVIARMRKNAQDANLRSSDVDELRVKKGPQRPSLSESIEAAAKGIKFSAD